MAQEWNGTRTEWKKNGMEEEWNETRQDWNKNIMEQEWNIYEGRNGNKTKGVKKRTDPRGNAGTVLHCTAEKAWRRKGKARPGQPSKRILHKNNQYGMYVSKVFPLLC